MQTTPRHAETIETNRLQTRLDMILEKYQDMNLDENEPFVLYLTERMLSDIEDCRRAQRQQIRQRATWPSLN
ncbi:MAG: hypothetical protein QM703_04250 [Gemmatales bacterium]